MIDLNVRIFACFTAQMFLMNRFFDGEFMTFGLDVIAHMEADQEDRMDPMIYIFPRMTKCTFYKYGVSGEVSPPRDFRASVPGVDGRFFVRRLNGTTPFAYCH